MYSDKVLFADYSLRQVCKTQLHGIRSEIEHYDSGKLLNTSVDDLVDYYVARARFETITLDVDNTTVSHQEVEFTLGHEHGRDFGAGPSTVSGQLITYHVPFSGGASLFLVSATYSQPVHVYAVQERELLIAIARTRESAGAVKQKFTDTVRSIEQNLQWIEADLAPFYADVPAQVRRAILERRSKLLDDAQLVQSLGFPLRRREDAVETYSVPDIRRRVVTRSIEPPTASRGSYVPEPALADSDYEYILEVLTRLSLLMERSPETFRKLTEEEIRDHFLLHLNGHYDGRATGETFNFQGKTDILIREGKCNIFIAECKFWTGSKSLTETIDQLLGYLSWRDTKTAILLFNRNKDLSSVLSQVPLVASAHPNFKRTLGQTSDTQWRFQFHQPTDRNRELVLSILAFDVPV